MNNRDLPIFLQSLKEPDQANRVPTRYALWKGTSDLYWNNPNNWSTTGVPSGNKHVIFAGNAKLFAPCIINSDVSVKTIFARRDYVGGYLTFNSNKNITVQKQIRLDSKSSTSFNFNNVVLCTGHFIIDSPAFLSLGQSIFDLSGNLRITQGDPVDNLSTITYRTSGNYIYSTIPLNKINILYHTDISGSLVVRGRMNLSGTAHMAAGDLIFDGTQAKLNVGSGGWTYGDGMIVIQNEARIERQSGYLDNANLTITHNNIGNVLAPGIYSCRHVRFSSTSQGQDTVLFENGNYRFESDVEFLSLGGGELEINTGYGNANIEFDKNVDVIKDVTNNSRITWVPGSGIITLGKPRTIAKDFQQFQYGLGHSNTVDMSRGLVLSHQHFINESPVIYAINATGTNTSRFEMLTADGHTIGNLDLGITGQQFGDITYGGKPIEPSQLIFIGDIADTGANRDLIYIYQTTEPTITGYGIYGSINARTWSGVYQTGNNIPSGELGGRSRDCRAMFMKYDSSDIFFITHKTNPPQLFYITGHGGNHLGHIELLQYLGNLNIPSGVVGADISRDGTKLLVKRWDEVYHYTINGTGVADVAYALTGTNPVRILDYSPDYQEHGIAWGSGENSFHTIATFNSGLHDPILRSPFYTYDRKATINLTGTRIDNLVVDASGHIKHFISSGTFESWAMDYGTVDVGYQKLTSLGDMYVGPNSNFNRRGFNNSTINIGGDLLIVGFPNKSIFMHPDLASGIWYLNVTGSATAYYTSARASNASGGSTVYAYNSYDYGDNINWNFVGGGTGGAGIPVSGGLYLYLNTYTYPVQSGGIPLFIRGKTGDSTGVLYLYVSGNTPGLTTGNLYLYTSGSPNIASNDISLFLNNLGVADTVPLFIHGRDYTNDSGSVLYLVVKNDGFGSGLTLYTQGSIPTSGTMDLYVAGNSQFSSGIDLYIGANGIIDGNPTRVRLYTHGRHIT